MPQEISLRGREQSVRRMLRWRWSSRIAFLIMLVVNACALAAAAICLSREATQSSEELRAAAGAVLAVCALWQTIVLRRVYARRDRLKAFTLGFVSPFWQWLILALAGSYLIALAIGPGVRAQNTFAALAMLSYTIVLDRFTRGSNRTRPAPRAVNRPRVSLRQSVAWAICGLIVVVCGAELSLRIADHWSDQPTPVANYIRRATLPPGVEFRGRTANQLGFWDDEFRLASASSTPRVVILGDELTLSGDAETNFVAKLEKQLAGADVQHFGVARTGLREYGVVLAAEAARFRPHLAIVVVNLANDITDQPELPGVFDWRGLRLYEWSLRRWHPERLTPIGQMRTEPPAHDYESLLQAAERDLAVCRTPLDEATREKWQAAFASLKRLQATCERIDCQLVVIMTPSRAQVDDALRQRARQRMGLAEENIDGSLPQRRMIAFAEEFGLALVDLTPLVAQSGCQSFARNENEWTAEAHERVATFLAPAIEARLDVHKTVVPQDVVAQR